MVDVSQLSPNPDVRILVKLEGRNPGGSVKDRVALSLVEQAERDGVLVPGKPGQVLIEPTSGNTGIGLALVCRVKGYHLKVVLPTNVSVERRQLLELWGAEIIESPGSEGSNGAVRMAQRLAERAPRVGLPLPVRQPGQPEGPLRGHRTGDLAGLPRGHPPRGGPRHLGHPARRRPLPEGAEPRHRGLGGRAAGRRDGRRAAQPRRRLHPARSSRSSAAPSCSTARRSSGPASRSSGPGGWPRSGLFVGISTGAVDGRRDPLRQADPGRRRRR